MVEINLKNDFNNENPFSARSINCKNIKSNILDKIILNDINVDKFNRLCKIYIQDLIRINTQDRNKPAYGEISFEDFGKNITIEDAKKKYLSIVVHLRKYLQNIKLYY